MNTKQVFCSYPVTEAAAPDVYRFCPCCGNWLERRESSGRVRPVCPVCGFVYYRNPSPGVTVLIVEDGRVLLGKRGPGSFEAGKWGLPGGFVEWDEDILTAARREVAEETGLAIELLATLNVCSNFLAPNLHTIVPVFLGRPCGGTLRAGDDIEALRWFPLTGPFPELAFIADEHIIHCYAAGVSTGIPLAGPREE